MSDKQLANYNNSFFSKIKEMFFRIFNKNTDNNINNTNNNNDNNDFNNKNSNSIVNNKTIQKEIEDSERKKDNFIEELSVNKSKRQRISYIKEKYENNQIDEKDISEEDKNELTRIYKEETIEINKEIEKRKYNISKMIEKLKNSTATQNFNS